MPSPTISETTMLVKGITNPNLIYHKTLSQSSFYFPSFLVTLQSMHKNNLSKKHEPYIIPLLRVLQLRSSSYDHKTQYDLTTTSLPAPLQPHPLVFSLSVSLFLSLSHLTQSVHILIFFLEYNSTLASESLDFMYLLPGILYPPAEILSHLL